MSDLEGRAVVTVIHTETMVLPKGCSADDDMYDMFAAYVRWQSTRGWVVTTRFKDTRLSVKGRKWTAYVHKRNRHLYYFPTYEDAMRAAQWGVEFIMVMGRTWGQWQDHRGDKLVTE